MNNLKVVYFANEENSFDDDYALSAHIVDAENGVPITQTVEFRDVLQVRAYYNGWCSALGMAGVREITVSHARWPYVRQTYRVPAFLDFERKVPA